MIELIYKRLVANVVDIRYFEDDVEFEDWLERQSKLEPVGILKKSIVIKEGEGQ